MSVERIWRGAAFNDYPLFRVTITRPGPRGGKRPPLIDIETRAESYDEAVDFAVEKLITRCDITVKY